MALQPGGTQTAPNEVSWDDGAVVLTLETTAGPAPLAVGGCATGKFCAYTKAGYAGDKITFSTCTLTQSPAALNAPVRSIANSRTTGTIRAYATNILLATAAPGTGKGISSGTTTNITCS